MTIGIYAAKGGAGGPYVHPLIMETLTMLQTPFLWWENPDNDADAIRSLEYNYITSIQRYLKVDGDDPTCIVDDYVNAWWKEDYRVDEVNLCSYVFNVPHTEHLAVHRPQVSNVNLV